MQNYIQFYSRLLNGEIDEATGSDSVMPLDGRLSLVNMELQGYEQAHRLRKVQRYVGFKVMYGTNFRTSGRPCTEMKYLDYDAMSDWIEKS